MKAAAVAVAVAFLVALLFFAVRTYIAGVETAVRLRVLEQAQEERLAAVHAEVEAVGVRLDEIAGALSDDVAKSRDAARRQLEVVEGRVQRSFSSVQGRLAQASVEQARMGERLSEELRTATSEIPAQVSAELHASLEAAAARLQVTPASEAPELDLPLQREMEKAVALFDAGRYAEACERFSAVLDRQPGNDAARLYHAVSLYYDNPADSGSYARIEAELAGSADPAALRVLGLVAVERQQWGQALGYLQRVVAAVPGNAIDAKMAGICSLRVQDHAGARRYLDLSCSLTDGDAEAWHYAGLSYLESGDAEAALARFSRCLQIDGDFTAARIKAAAALMALGRGRDALQVLAVPRRSAEAAALSGDCHERLGEAAEARAAWHEALGLIRENTAEDRRRAAELYLRLARSAWQSAAYAESVSFCREGLRREPAPLLQVYLGASQTELGEVEKGKRLLQEVVDSYPQTEACELAGRMLAAATGRR